jgi:hypothetical protein
MAVSEQGMAVNRLHEPSFERSQANDVLRVAASKPE